ncbi:hypothetical protein NITHO_820005 [Nitrolancea hollandica Lb]|uniref:Uncharacterized protein n=1 Tax=Nitrolancea hollandica Lb TaxID=1129897 RepID=I4ENA7_9BACT|nr:hypothetical protein NITHO_820005 [Nitrolancea hollandica Lb]
MLVLNPLCAILQSQESHTLDITGEVHSIFHHEVLPGNREMAEGRRMTTTRLPARRNGARTGE